MYKKKTYKATSPTLEVDEEPVKIETKIVKSKWIIDATLTMKQREGVIELLESGMKPRKVALHFGFHRSKIRLAE